MKKLWIWILIVALLLAAVCCGIGYYMWYENNHVFVEDAVYEKELTFLDLRGTGRSLEHYEEAKRLLPDCEIRYDLEFQGKFYADDTRELTVTSLTEEEAALLDYLPALTAVHAEGCRDYGVLEALRSRRPKLQIHYTVALFGQEYDWDTRSLEFGSEDLDLKELEETIPSLTKLERVFFDQPSAPAAELTALKEAFPELDITWEKDALGATYSSEVTEIDLTGMVLDSPEEIVEPLAYFPELEKVILSECGPTAKDWFDNETMAAFREQMRDQYKVVWTVKINSMRVRTDETYFMPNKDGYVVTDYQVQNLKYCEDMLCVDLGHMTIRDISFVEGMPHLKYFIVIDGPLMYIDSLSTCKELIYLELFWTCLNDYTPLLGCTALEDVNVARTNGDPMVFQDMPWLKNLWIDGNDVHMSERPILEAALPNTYIKYCDHEMTRNGWRDLQNYFDMRDLLGMPYNAW